MMASDVNVSIANESSQEKHDLCTNRGSTRWSSNGLIYFQAYCGKAPVIEICQPPFRKLMSPMAGKSGLPHDNAFKTR